MYFSIQDFIKHWMTVCFKYKNFIQEYASEIILFNITPCWSRENCVKYRHTTELYDTLERSGCNRVLLIFHNSPPIGQQAFKLIEAEWRIYASVNYPSLSHPSLGWLYVFSSFPPPPLRPPPPPPPQRLLLLTSKPFELHLRYLGQRKYRSGKMYWMTFWWPWPKVRAVTLINTNLLVCRMKWEPLIQSLQNLVALFLWSRLSPD